MEIKVATTIDELKEIAALRYQVFIREQGVSAFFADAASELFLEPVDAFNESTVVYAQEDTKIVASIRVEHRLPDWLLRQLDPVPGGHFNLKHCFAMWGCQLSSMRGERYFDSLILSLTEHLSLNFELCLITCKVELIDMYIQYAFQKTGYIVEHPDTGTRHLLALLACSDGVRGTRLRSFAGRFKHELSMERKAELYKWLKL